MIRIYGRNAIDAMAILLEERASTYALLPANRWRHDPLHAEFAPLIGLGRAPTLVDASSPAGQWSCILEPKTALIHLALGHDPLLPEEDIDAKYEILDWIDWHYGVMPADSTSDTSAILREIDQRLSGRDFIAAKRHSVADIISFAWVSEQIRRGMPIEHLEAVQRWRKPLAPRPAVRRAQLRVGSVKKIGQTRQAERKPVTTTWLTEASGTPVPARSARSWSQARRI
jgi:glutathione S-transferase